jgi:hypothetical protein
MQNLDAIKHSHHLASPGVGVEAPPKQIDHPMPYKTCTYKLRTVELICFPSMQINFEKKLEMTAFLLKSNTLAISECAYV